MVADVVGVWRWGGTYWVGEASDVAGVVGVVDGLTATTVD